MVGQTSPPREEPQLKRRIGLYAATAITVGSIIGSGIFRSPHSVAQELTSPAAALLAWVLGGVLSMCGSLALSEMAVTHPRTGGLYVFIRESFGDRLAFIFGWASLWVIKPTVIASIASVFATYFCQAVGLGKGAEFFAGFGAIAFLTFVNLLGVKQGTATQTVLTTLKVLGILVLCLAAFLLPHAGAPHGQVVTEPHRGHPFLLAFAFAMIPIFFAYDGWTDSTYVGGEIVNPARNFPIAILGGTMLVVAVYVITNLAYFSVLSPAEVGTYEAVGAEAMRRILGDWGGRSLAILVAISTFGTVNASILTGPRVTLAMAADGLFWKRAAHVNVERGTPDVALWIQGALSTIWLWFAGGFEDVSGWFVTTSWLFYGLTVAALFVYRRKVRQGVLPAPSYHTPLFPITPLVFILVTVAIVASDLSSSGWRAAAGVLVAALGFPFSYVWARKGRKGATADSTG
ncbi:MAG TPA: amino acid permease [Candidatus Eisenbacteria bacterium]|jgi:amino acid transporter